MAAQPPLKFITVPPRSKHTATVIFVHVRTFTGLSMFRISKNYRANMSDLQGLGDSGLGWQDVAEIFGRQPALGHIKWVLPHA